MRELLIVGVDPGTTVGYAVLDTKGNVLKLRSSKQLELNSVVEEISGIGSVLAIGTDKRKCPGLIEKSAAKTGAKIITPKDDIMVAEKDAITRGYQTQNEHEKDALAAAMYAYKELEPLLQRIGKTLEKEGKQELFGEVTEVVVMAGRNIKDTLREIEEKMCEAQHTSRFASKEGAIATAAAAAAAAAAATTAPNDRNSAHLKRAEKENEILRSYNQKLLARIKHLGSDLNRVRKSSGKMRRPQAKAKDKDKDEDETHNAELIAKMQKIINEKDRLIARLKEEHGLLGRILASGDVVVKKLNTLGFEELRQKNGMLRIAEEDTVLVENPDVFSEKAIRHLQQKNVAIITKKKISEAVAKLLADNGLTALPADNIITIESGNFAAADKEQLEEAKAKRRFEGKIKNVLGVIEEYKEERKLQLQET